MDMASLGLKIDTSGVERGVTKLAELAGAAGRAESATEGVSAAFEEAGRGARSASSAISSAAAAQEASARAGKQFTSTLREQSQLSGSSAANAARHGRNLQLQSAEQTRAAVVARQEAEAQRAAAQAKRSAEAAQQSFIASLREQVALQGKSQADVLRYRATQLGVAKDAETYIAQIERSAASTGKLGLSAGQTAQAMRLLPAQITDIVTGLASGQRPFMVAIQQGGQLRDSFGGIGNALKAMGTILTPTRLLLGGVAGVVALLAKGFLDGQRESFELNQQLILSGNAAGVTTGRLYAMSRAIDSVSGTQREAVQALSQIAATGRVSAEHLQEFAQVAVNLQRTAGTPIEETAKAFAELGRSPAEAARKLNEQTNFLTVATYRQISALERQGRTFEAGEIAQRAYARALDERTQEIEQHLGLLQRLGRGTADAFREARDALLSIGRPTPIADELAEVQERIRQLQQLQARFTEDKVGGLFTDRARRLAQLEQERARLQELVKAQDEAANAQERQRQALERYIASEQRSLAVGEARRESLELIAKAQHESSLRGINSVLQASLSGQQAAFAQLDALRAADVIKDREYYRLKRQFVEDATSFRVKALQDERAQIAAEIQRLEGERIAAGRRVDVTVGPGGSRRSTPVNREAEVLKAQAPFQREIIQLRQRLLELEGDITAAKRDGAIETVKLNTAEQSGAAAAEKALTKARDAAQLYVDTLKQANDRRLAGAGLGDRQREELEARNRIDDEFAKQIADLDPTQTFYEERKRALQEANRDALAENDRYFKALADQQSSFTIGAREALANYLDGARNVAAQSQKLFTNAFDGMTDSLAKFATTGKLDFKSLAESIIADLIRIQIRAALAGILGNSAGGIGGILGAIFGGPVGGTGAGGGTIPVLGPGGSMSLYADTGIRRVPRDNQVAILHKDEAVIPAKMNPFAGGRGFGGPNVTIHQTLNAGPGVDVAQIQSVMRQSKDEAVREVFENLSKGRWAGAV